MGGFLSRCRPSFTSTVTPLPSISPSSPLHPDDPTIALPSAPSSHLSASSTGPLLLRQDTSHSKSSRHHSPLPSPIPNPPTPHPPPSISPSSPSRGFPPPLSPTVLNRHLQRKAAIKRLKEVKRTMFAQCLSESELVCFSDLFEVQIVEGGTVIFHQDGVADTFYIIRKGEVNMKFRDKESMHQAAAIPLKSPASTNRTLASDAQRAVVNQGAAPHDFASLARAMKGMGRLRGKRRANSMQVDSAEVSAMKLSTPTATMTPTFTDTSPTKVNQPPPLVTSHSRFFSYAATGREKDHRPTTSSLHNSSPFILPPLPSQPEEEEFSRNTTSPSSSFALLATKSSGDFFGLEALRFGENVRTCVCIAVTQTSLLTLSATTFHRFVDSLNNKEKRKKLYDLVGGSLQACLQQMPYLSGVSAAKISLLSSLFVWTSLPSQSILFEEGERDKKGNGLYFLYEGTVGVWCNDSTGQSQLLKELTPGVCFGELGLIIHLPRTATIRAHSPCLLLHLPHRSFHNFLHLTPEILTKFKEQIETYQLNVVYLLENELISQYFFQHCAREYSTENLEFWWEAKKYRVTSYADEERRVEAERIMKLYITDSSPKQINLKGNTQKNILNALHCPPVKASPRCPHSPSSPRSPPLLTVDSQLFLEAENEIFNLLATDSFSRFKASPLFHECLEEMHVRVRSSSISVGKEGIQGLREGKRSPSESPSSSMNSRESPEPSLLSPHAPVTWEEMKEEEGVGKVSFRGEKTAALQEKRSSGRKQLPSLNRSNTTLGMGAVPPHSTALRRTNTTTMRVTTQGPIIEHILTAQQEEKEEAKELHSTPRRKERPPRTALAVDPPSPDDDVSQGGSLRYSPTNATSPSHNAAEAANAAFDVFLNSGRKAATQPLISPSHSSPPPDTAASAASPPTTLDPFSPSARVAAAVAARNRVLHTQLVAKALSSARGSIEPIPDSPSSSVKRKLGILRINSLKTVAAS